MTIPDHFLKHKNDFAYLAKAYDITPIRRFQCLPHKSVPGIYQPLTALAYQFTAVRRSPGAKPFVFNTGYVNGDKILLAINKSLPPLETWETILAAHPAPDPNPAPPSQASTSAAPAQSSAPAPALPAPPVTCAFNSALLQLLNLFFLKYEFDPSKPSGQIFVAINNNPAKAYENGALAANTILINCHQTSASLIAWLHGQVGAAKVRPFDFSILRKHLQGLPSPPNLIAI